MEIQVKSILIIIRTYPVDDFISYLCYRSWKAVLPDAKFIFFCQNETDPPPGKYKCIAMTGEQMLIRPYCCNFGGRDHVRAYIDGLKKIDTTGYDKIACCDADVTMIKNPFEHEFDFAGISHYGYTRLYSGQLLMFDKKIFDRVVGYTGYEELFEQFIKDGYRSISDDTIISWLVTEWGVKVFDFFEKNYWHHYKLHHLEKIFE
jgi:hypothetical protein